MEIDYTKYLQTREHFQFTDVNIYNQSKIKCKRCKLLLIKPFQTDCGFRCCFKCIDQINNQSIDKCPFCGIKQLFTSHTHRDRSIENEIMKLTVNCLNENCNETISMKVVLNHFEDDIHIKTRCSTCSSLLTNENETLHRYGIICQNCFLRKRETIAINLETGKECPNNCCIKTYDNIECHLKNCPKQIINCFFSDFGCIEKLRRENLNTHLMNNHKIYGEVLNDNLIKSNIYSLPSQESSIDNAYFTAIPETGDI